MIQKDYNRCAKFETSI